MAATPQTLLIPFKGGLDTYSNAHLLPAGFLTSSLGTMLDRPGTAYPGPGFEVARWAPSATGNYTNHGIAALNHGPNTDADQLVFWSTISGGSGPGVSVAGASAGTLAPTQQRLAPWRQATQRFSNNSRVYLPVLNTVGNMVGPPQCAVTAGRVFYAWLSGTSSCVQMVYQDLDTHAWSVPYYLDNSGDWVTTETSLRTAVGKVSIAGDGTYLRVTVLLGTVLRMYSYTGTSPLTHVTVTTPAGNFNMIDSVGTGDESASGYGAIIAMDNANHKIVGFAFSYAASTFGASVDLITGLSVAARPMSISPIKSTTVSTGFLIMGLDTSDQPNVCVTTLSLGSPTVTAITGVTFTSGAGRTARAVSVANTVSGSSATVAIAVEMLGTTSNWNRVYLGVITLAAPSVIVSSSTLQGWGGLALLGKFYGWYNGTEFRPMIALRSGWWNKTGAWGSLTAAGTGTFAYPNGYLYDYAGTLFAKFGDADVGTDALWPAFDDVAYAGTLLQPVPSGFQYTLGSGQATLSYVWPQYGYVEFYSTRSADSGSPIGTRAGLSTVTWSAPSASEPAAAAVQFGTSLVIPGAITAIFDGSAVFEAGFFHRAPSPGITSNGGGGSLPNATVYYFQTVMVYQDAGGKIHRSAPSLLVYGLTTAVNDAFNITFPACQQTLKNTLLQPILIELYRSTGNPTSTTDLAMYQVTAVTATNVVGATSAMLTAAQDGTADADLRQCETVYTYNMQTGASGGTFSPPPFDSLTIWNNQVWGVANVNGPELWCTWPQDTATLGPEGPAWSVANRLPLPAEIGQPRAIAGLDEKLLVLGSRADYGIIAGGTMSRDTSILDNPGLFSAPLLLPTPGGIKTLNGGVRIPKGLLFQGTQGFNILGRDLQYTPVGMPVKDFTRSNLYLPGVFLPEQSAVLLFSASDVTKNLVFFYDTDEWAQTEQPPADATNTAPAAVMVGAVRTVAGQSSQVYALASTQPYYVTVHPFSKYMSYRTPWIELDDRVHGVRSVAGSGILREVQVLGVLPDGFTGNQTLTLYTEYDYPGNTSQLPETQTLALRSETQADLEYQWRFGFFQGNAKRVRFTVTVNGGVRTFSDTDSAPVLLTGLQLSYDVDTGLSRMGASNSTGT